MYIFRTLCDSNKQRCRVCVLKHSGNPFNPKGRITCSQENLDKNGFVPSR